MSEQAAGGAAVPKVCAVCGVDCAGKPRRKDSRGRYICGPCVDRLAARAGGAPRVGRSDGADTLRASAEGPLAVIEVDTALPPGVPSPLDEPAIDKAPVISCPSCGYDVRGLARARCPECGLALSRREVRRVLDRQHSRSVQRWAYLRPAIIGGVCTLLMAALLGWRYGGFDAALGACIGVAACTVGVFIVLFVCQLWFLGFDAPARLVITQVFAVAAGVSLAYAVFGAVPSFWIAFGPPAIICIALMGSECDLDTTDATLVGLPSSLTIFGVWALVAKFIL